MGRATEIGTAHKIGANGVKNWTPLFSPYFIPNKSIDVQRSILSNIYHWVIANIHYGEG